MSQKLNRNLLSIGVISAAAFIGFGAIFHELNISIATQAITASFGALFVLLSTKFLMEQESETRVQGEKTSKIFEEQLREYKNVSDCMLKILQDDNITLQEVHTLLDKHAILILIGEQAAIEKSGDFITTCQAIIGMGSIHETYGKYQIDEDANSQLNEILIEFLTAARADLRLKSDFDAKTQKDRFSAVSDEQKQLEIRVRGEVSLSDWRGVKNKSASIPSVQTFIEVLEKRGLKYKITSNQITFRSSTIAGGNIIYLNNFTKDQCFTLNFSAQPDKDFLERQAEEISEFTPKVVKYKNKFNLNLKIPVDDVSNEKLGNFFRVIDAIVDKYKAK